MTLNKYTKNILAAVFWTAVWYLTAESVGQDLVLPGPVPVLRRLAELCRDPYFWQSAFLSLLRVFGGFAAGVAAGTILAAMTSSGGILDTLLSPLIKVIRAVPVASFIILALLWIGRDSVPAFVSALIVIPVVWGAVSGAIAGTDSRLLEMARAYRFGKLKTLRYVYIPSVFPAWITSSVTTLGLAWKSGIAAEVLCLPKKAIGTQLYYSKIYLETPSLFAWTAVVILLSFILEYAFTKILKGGGSR